MDSDSDTKLGTRALPNNKGYANNTAVGFKSLEKNGEGFTNTSVGAYCLNKNQISHNNTAIGYKASRNTLGEYNTSIGAVSGLTIEGGNKNTLLGKGADVSTKNAENQIVIGQGAVGLENDSIMLGNQNIKAVYLSKNKNARLHSGVIHINNEKGQFEYKLPNKDGQKNYVLKTDGEGVLTWTKKGAINLNGLNDCKANLVFKNTFIGENSGKNNTSSLTEGNNNIGLGVDSLKSNTTGLSNVSLGPSSLENNVSGDANICIGKKSGSVIETGNSNIVIGSESEPSANSSSNQIVIGHNSVGHGDNIAVIGSNDESNRLTSIEPGRTNICDLGSTNYRFKKLNVQKINVNDLPTSAIGLEVGDIYSDSGTLKVKLSE